MSQLKGKSRTNYQHEPASGRFKIVVVGDSNVGKSCLLIRYADSLFNDTYIATIGVDFRAKTVFVDGIKVKLQIWDTAGHERFRSINSSYFRGCDGALICYDICNRESFQNVTYHLSQVRENGGRYVSFILVGNKSDSTQNRMVSKEEAAKLANELEMPHFEVSARSSENVDAAFEGIARRCVAQRKLELRLKKKQQKELDRLAEENRGKSTKIKFCDVKQAVRESGDCKC